MTPKLVYFKSRPEMTFEASQRRDISVITSKSVDLEGDIIEPDGLNWDSWQERGAPVHFGHGSLKVGRALWVKSKGDKITAMTEYDRAPKGWTETKPWIGDLVWDAVQKGILTGKSITVLPDDCREPTDTEKAAGAKRVISKGLVMEYSVCKTPVNEDAVVEEIRKSLDNMILEALVDPNKEIAAELEHVFQQLREGQSR